MQLNRGKRAFVAGYLLALLALGIVIASVTPPQVMADNGGIPPDPIIIDSTDTSSSQNSALLPAGDATVLQTALDLILLLS